MTIREKALTWWGSQAKKDQYVVSAAEIPDRRQREYLKKAGYLFPVARGYWALKKPEDDAEEVFLLIYWQAVEKVLSSFTWSLRGSSALAIHNGAQAAQEHLMVRSKEKTNWKLTLPLGFTVNLRYDSYFDERLIKNVEVAGRSIPVEIPELVFIELDKATPKEVQSFVAGTKFDRLLIEAIYARKPRPVVFNRLIGLARKYGRSDLAVDIEKIIETYTHYQIAKREAVSADEIAVKQPQVIHPPWVIRQEVQIKEFEAALEKGLKTKISKIKKRPLKELLAQAREHKKYDTYHSTTLEGYQITPEQVEALLSGIVPEEDSGPDYFDKMRNRMAIVGYSEAFDFVLEQVESDFEKPKISEQLVKETYAKLFKPSLDAKIVDLISLTTYRNIAAFIRGTNYIPPSWEKLPDLMSDYEQSIGAIKNPVIKAILAHYYFVAIHPYIDGNGRTSRLLMNYTLLSSGYSWITIRADQRSEYFGALNKGTVDGDILPFGEFIMTMLKSAGK